MINTFGSIQSTQMKIVMLCDSIAALSIWEKPVKFQHKKAKLQLSTLLDSPGLDSTSLHKHLIVIFGHVRDHVRARERWPNVR